MTKPLRTLGSTLLLLAALGCTPGSNRPPREMDAGVTTTTCPNVGQTSAAEVCNAFDDDCDGVMDEGVCDDPCGVFDETPLE